MLLNIMLNIGGIPLSGLSYREREGDRVERSKVAPRKPLGQRLVGATLLRRTEKKGETAETCNV